MAEIIPAIIPSSLEDLKDKISLVVGYVPTIQIDVCDGKFVPTKSWPYYGGGYDDYFKVILNEDEGLPEWEKVDFEIDILAETNEQVIADWVKAGAKRLVIHVEAVNKDIKTLLRKVNKEYRWRSRGKIIKKIICNIDRTYKDKKSGIKFYLYDNGKKLCIKFKNPEWIKEHEFEFIKILGVLLLVTNEYYDKNWHLCEIVYEDFLEDGDVSEQNNYIKICEDEVLVVRGELIQEDIVDIFINR